MQPSHSASTSFSVPNSPHNSSSLSKRTSWNRSRSKSRAGDQDPRMQPSVPDIDTPPTHFATYRDPYPNPNELDMDMFSAPPRAPPIPRSRRRSDPRRSLDHESPTDDYPPGASFDDVRLTADAERVAVSERYGHHLTDETVSPLKMGGEVLSSAGKRLRRVSVRVVNLAGLDVHQRTDGGERRDEEEQIGSARFVDEDSPKAEPSRMEEEPK